MRTSYARCSPPGVQYPVATPMPLRFIHIYARALGLPRLHRRRGLLVNHCRCRSFASEYPWCRYTSVTHSLRVVRDGGDRCLFAGPHSERDDRGAVPVLRHTIRLRQIHLDIIAFVCFVIQMSCLFCYAFVRGNRINRFIPASARRCCASSLSYKLYAPRFPVLSLAFTIETDGKESNRQAASLSCAREDSDACVPR
ncbi:unnamed protein product [Rangifer tarandus platyrhynchus]|uniref:Uncharacterized protein n=1 Tax=Rangifer tarandus platyrhynchus TaxID=3082113 RepID=A0ABN8XMJ2_RANTA|nr:unnamed protein product [Rangifer tarandus platyrhynchus]